MRTIYHEFESIEHLLATRLLPGGGDHPIRFVVFGGTGAVGGATVLELPAYEDFEGLGAAYLERRLGELCEVRSGDDAARLLGHDPQGGEESARRRFLGELAILQDRHGRHLFSPGLIETVRMYTEGLGKVTGTESLWPDWGY